MSDSLFVREKPIICDIQCEYLTNSVSTVQVHKGSLLVTTFRFRFIFDNEIPKELSVQQVFTEKHIDIPLACIYAVEKKNNTLIIRSKNVRKVKIVIELSNMSKIYEILNHCIFPNDISFLFAFEHRLPVDLTTTITTTTTTFQSNILGWDTYVPIDEWNRQELFQDSKWRISTVNANFQLIPTYPKALVVPTNLSDEIVIQAVKFRSKGRIPAFSWIHPANRATIWRSSQPKVGVSNNTSTADETLVAAIGSANPINNKIQIVDCRARRNAMANRAKGHGTESVSNYTSSSIVFMNICNIHGVRESYRKLEKLSLSPLTNNSSWLGSVEDTKWLYHIRSILLAGLHVVNCIHNKAESVLIHCSHGWDRTSQVSSIAQILLDPYYRTFKGFQVLLDKEWKHFGHPFPIRQAYGKHPDNDYSPIFQQFLDCIWQLVNQFPSYFEFTKSLLLIIAEEVNSCRFGTFLFASEKEREEENVHNTTVSLWSYLDGLKDLFLNTTYQGIGSNRTTVLLPSASCLQRQVILWSEYYLRYSPQPSLPQCDCQNVIQENSIDWQLSSSMYNYSRHLQQGCLRNNGIEPLQKENEKNKDHWEGF